MNIYSLNVYSLWISLTSKYKKELLFNYMAAEIFFSLQRQELFCLFFQRCGFQNGPPDRASSTLSESSLEK